MYRFIEQTIQPGPEVSLKCVASGNPTPNIKWTLDGFPLPRSDNRYDVAFIGFVKLICRLSHCSMSSFTLALSGSFADRPNFFWGLQKQKHDRINFLLFLIQNFINKHSIIEGSILNTILFADQAIVGSREDEMQRAVYALDNIAIKYNLKISVNKVKAMAMKEKMNVRTDIVINNHIIEQANSSNHLGYSITVTNNRDLEININRFNQMRYKLRRTLNTR
jgi:hypothetical protein